MSNKKVPIPLNTTRELNSLKKKIIFDPNNYIFTNSSNCHLKNDTIRKSFTGLLKELKIENATFHTLRHTFATRLFENDVPLKTISILL
ncbi:tyrosine-type recombinase/integrase [Clostridium sp. Marseille-QA1073]